MNYLEENALDLFKFRAGNVRLWEKQSLSLKAAADIIYSNLMDIDKKINEHLEKGTDSAYLYYPTAGLNQVWMVSIGYSIECLLKAIIITITTEPIITSNNKLNMNIFGKKPHDLHSLLGKIDNQYKPNFTEEENSLIQKMSAYTIWRGKYPIPKGSRDLLEDLGPARLKNDRDKKFSDNIFDELYAKLLDARKAQIKEK